MGFELKKRDNKCVISMGFKIWYQFVCSQASDVHFVERKSMVISQHRNIIVRKSEIEIEVPVSLAQRNSFCSSNTIKINFEGVKHYVRSRTTDLRKGVSGLLAIIENETHLNALSNSVFFFCNKSHKLLKVDFLNKTEFLLAQKRLGMATLPWPNTRLKHLRLTVTEHLLNIHSNIKDIMIRSRNAGITQRNCMVHIQLKQFCRLCFLMIRA